MRDLEQNVPSTASDPDNSELTQPEMDDVSGGNNGGSGMGPPTPHH
jgi:hypothetical protein